MTQNTWEHGEIVYRNSRRKLCKADGYTRLERIIRWTGTTLRIKRLATFRELLPCGRYIGNSMGLDFFIGPHRAFFPPDDPRGQ